MKKLNKDEIKANLLKLAEKPSPDRQPIQAMCYSPGPPTEISYTCPACLHQTEYQKNSTDEEGKDLPYILCYILPNFRDKIEYGDCPWATLDESEFCKRCSPIISAPRINLKIRVEGEHGLRVVRGVEGWDNAMINHFLSQRKVEDSSDTLSLKEYIERIEFVLGAKKSE